MSEKKGGKRKKSYYIKAAKGKRPRMEYQLQAGQKGFLITCNNSVEKMVVREAYNLFAEYADKLYGPENPDAVNKDRSSGADSSKERSSGADSSKDRSSGEDSSSEEDIETSLQQELSALKSKPAGQRRFQAVSSGARSCVFIRTLLEDPDRLLHAIFSDVLLTRTSKSRYMMRILPVMASCRAEKDKIQSTCEAILGDFFKKTEPVSYMVVSKVRNNNDFGKQTILPIMQEVVLGLNAAHYFDGVNPEVVINVDIIKSMCCVSVLRDYMKFKKYNIQEVVKVAMVTEQKEVVATVTEQEVNKKQNNDLAEIGSESGLPQNSSVGEDKPQEDKAVTDASPEKSPDAPVVTSDPVDNRSIDVQASAGLETTRVK